MFLVLINIGWGFVRGIDNVWVADASEQNIIEGTNENDVLGELTGLDSAGTDMWLMVTTVGAAAALAFSWMVHSLTPLGIYLFGVAFWSSYNGTVTIIVHSLTPLGIYLFGVAFWSSYNGTVTIIGMNSWLPGDFILIITVAMTFLFIGAIIGMITGSG
jgi:hypothetical protein